MLSRATLALLAAAAVGCASQGGPSSPPSTTITAEIVVRFDADVSARIARIELDVDGSPQGSATSADLRLPPVGLMPGQHTIEIVLLLTAPADVGGGGAIWSTTATISVGLAPTDETSQRSTELVVTLAARPGPEPIARRLEARFKGEAFVSGALPRIEPVIGDGTDAARARGEDPLREIDQRVTRINAARSSVETMLRSAADQKDLVRATCVASKVPALRALSEQAEARRSEMVTAERAGDASTLVSGRAFVAQLEQTAEGLVEEARACSGLQVHIGGSD